MTHHCLGGGLVVLAAILVVALLTSPDEERLATDTRVTAAKAVSPNANDLRG
jgi:hypothetical protein